MKKKSKQHIAEQNALIIDNIKALFELEKDWEVAALLGGGSSSVSHMRSGNLLFSPKMFAFLCIAKDMRPSQMFMELGLPQDFFSKKDEI